MSVRRPLICANWKMNLGRTEEALDLVRHLRPRLSSTRAVDVVLCPPFTVLSVLAGVLEHSPVALGAQTMHPAEGGAHTGDVSAAMLRGLCDFVILGHSERRAEHGSSESDDAVRRTVKVALDHGLAPIVCVGESAEQRASGATGDFVGGQVRSALDVLTPAEVARCVFAYEPIWAIGSGEAATPVEANRTIGITVRGAIAECAGEAAAERVRILYGGSVSSGNIGGFMRMPEIDGALVGGASLTVEFAELVRRAADSAG